MSRKKRVNDAVALMDKSYNYIPNWDEMVARMQIGQALYDLRNMVGQSQADLAIVAGTNQSIISKVENADDNGSPLDILGGCLALHIKISIRCTPPPSEYPECQIVPGV